MNRYAYALNNPTSLLDPLGLYTLPCPNEDGDGGDDGGCGAGGYGGGSGGGGGVGRNGGGGGGGTGGDPVNKGNPITFSVTQFLDSAILSDSNSCVWNPSHSRFRELLLRALEQPQVKRGVLQFQQLLRSQRQSKHGQGKDPGHLQPISSALVL